MSYEPGQETLRRMAAVDRYNLWIAEYLRPHIGRRLLEVGCGLANMTPFFLKCDALVCLDRLEESVVEVREHYRDEHKLKAIVGDICDPELVTGLASSQFDTIICLNVLEHILDDRRALANMYALLQPGGKLLLLVPAGNYLYGHLDAALGHHRRYQMGILQSEVRSAGFRIDTIRYMNAAGIPGWFLASRVLKREAPPRGLLKLYNMLVPFFKWFEETFHPSFGQSILCIASKTAEGDI